MQHIGEGLSESADRNSGDSTDIGSPSLSYTNGAVAKTDGAQMTDWLLAVGEYVRVKADGEQRFYDQHALEPDRATFRSWMVDDVRGLPERRPDEAWWRPPACLSATDIEEEICRVVDTYLPMRAQDAAYEAGLPTVPARHIILVNFHEMVALNAKYLARPEVIEKLGYSESIALMIGGKHHGKTTNIRTAALSVARGLNVWGRKTTQGPVLYMASDDELAPTRNEFINMGMTENDPITVGNISGDIESTADEILEQIAEDALRLKAVMIVLDMLFDYAGIKDELSYAGTRGPIAAVQRLADQTKALVMATHHTPKYLNANHSAENAALGSQGIGARFSPIILTRKWTERLYTVESTTVRDPRGVALPPTKITRNEQGWIAVVGEFKEWMKWEIYAERVMALFDGNKGLTVSDVHERLDLDPARAQNTLKELTKDGKLVREKDGRKFVYYLASVDMFERGSGHWNSDA
jgi:predicted transcriptional regulator